MTGGEEREKKPASPKAARKGTPKKATRKKAARKTTRKKATRAKATGAKTPARKTTRKAKTARPKASATPAAPVPEEVVDPFAPTVSAGDLERFADGSHPRVHRVLGAHPRTLDGIDGVSFAVWAPGARRVSVTGDFCDWDDRRHPLRPLGTSGVHERFVPGVKPGAFYKFVIETHDGQRLEKTDPYGCWMQQAPEHASRVVAPDTYHWGDADWLAERGTQDPLRSPISIYEVHLGSFLRVIEEDDRPLTYREIAPILVERAHEMGFTHIELMPIMEHPFGGSWGYQVTGYFAPTSRYGTPDDLRFLIDTLHQAGLGVILDWVPAHFPGDEHGLARFDGTALYEHEDPRKGRHPDWDTYIFNYGRNEVANLLLANAVYWLEEFHVDGLRVDAVASMLYLDYSREAGEWVPNDKGGRENLEAIDFIKQLNAVVRNECPGCLMIAEESTSWPGVTAPLDEGGLGFHFKWNLGWMHDTLGYLGVDPLYRPHHHDHMTFPFSFEHTERFLMPLSHDEVVHGKGSLYGKMHGDEWQRLANLRLLLTYQFTRTGKKLLFMGTELASPSEWDHDNSLDWHLAEEPARQGMHRFLCELGKLYRETPCLWKGDPDDGSFSWIQCEDREFSVFSYQRWAEGKHVVVVLNCTPVPRLAYRLGAPIPGTYRELLSSDAKRFGGSGGKTKAIFDTETEPHHGQPQSLLLDLPPLGALVLGPDTES